MLGICNGFQVLCEAGLLPGALLPNDSLRFVCRQVELVVESAETPFTGGVPRRASGSRSRSSTSRAATSRRPAQLDELEARGGVVLRYAPGQNPNGSVRDIAGVVNERGNVDGADAPSRARRRPLTGSEDGLRIFDSAGRARPQAASRPPLSA